MFEIFSSGDEGQAGLKQIHRQFCAMLEIGHKAFVTACRVLLNGEGMSNARKEFFDMEQNIDSTEQRIRRELVVHATVHGVTSFPACLILMSIVKDAERLGDYASNLFDLAPYAERLKACDRHPDLVLLEDRISNLFSGCLEAFRAQQNEQASRLIRESAVIEDYCDDKILDILNEEQPDKSLVACTLVYRYFKRIASHVRNILTSIVQPLDFLDYINNARDAKEEDR